MMLVVGIDRELNREMRRAHRAAFLELVHEHPELTLADLVRLARGRYASVFAELTIGEIVFGEGQGRAPRAARSPAPVSTRRPSERANHEQAILSTLDVARAWMSASAIRARVGGSSAQTRAALNRLIDAGKVVYQGQARGTKYRSSV